MDGKIEFWNFHKEKLKFMSNQSISTIFIFSQISFHLFTSKIFFNWISFFFLFFYQQLILFCCSVGESFRIWGTRSLSGGRLQEIWKCLSTHLAETPFSNVPEYLEMIKIDWNEKQKEIFLNIFPDFHKYFSLLYFFSFFISL